jgi:hypothetical protein
MWTICPNMRNGSEIFSNFIVLISFSISLIFDDFDPIKNKRQNIGIIKFSRWVGEVLICQTYSHQTSPQDKREGILEELRLKPNFFLTSTKASFSMTSTPQAINAETSVSLKVDQIKKSISVSVVFTPDFATRLQQIFVDLFIITKQLRTLRTEKFELNCGTIERRLGINQKPKKEHYCSSYTKWPKEYLWTICPNNFDSKGLMFCRHSANNLRSISRIKIIIWIID